LDDNTESLAKVKKKTAIPKQQSGAKVGSRQKIKTGSKKSTVESKRTKR
jgi:hypothetical protein